MTQNKWSWLFDRPSSDLPGKQKFLKIVALLAICVCVPMGLYWFLVRDNPIRCIFGDAECSLTVSTYLLDSLTAMVFAATLIAAMYAKAAFEHERHSGISVHQCSGTQSCGLSGRRDLYFDDELKQFTTATPRAFDEDTWGVANIDCIGIGKSPLIGCELNIAFGKATEDDDQKFKAYPVRIASMRADGETHVHLHFSETHAEEKVFVRAAWQQIGGDFRFYLVDPVLDIGNFTVQKPLQDKEPEEPVIPDAPPSRPAGLADPPPLEEDDEAGEAVTEAVRMNEAATPASSPAAEAIEQGVFAEPATDTAAAAVLPAIPVDPIAVASTPEPVLDATAQPQMPANADTPAGSAPALAADEQTAAPEPETVEGQLGDVSEATMRVEKAPTEEPDPGRAS